MSAKAHAQVQADRVHDLAQRREYSAAADVLSNLILSGRVALCLVRVDLVADIVHDSLRHRPAALSTVVNYAFYILPTTAPTEVVPALTALLTADLNRSQRSAILQLRGALSAAAASPAARDNLNAALVDLCEAHTLCSDNAQALYLQSKVLRGLGRTEEASDALARYLTCAPTVDVHWPSAKYESLVLHCKAQPTSARQRGDEAQSLVTFLRRGIAEAERAEVAIYGQQQPVGDKSAKFAVLSLCKILEAKIRDSA